MDQHFRDTGKRIDQDQLCAWYTIFSKSVPWDNVVTNPSHPSWPIPSVPSHPSLPVRQRAHCPLLFLSFPHVLSTSSVVSRESFRKMGVHPRPSGRDLTGASHDTSSASFCSHAPKIGGSSRCGRCCVTPLQVSSSRCEATKSLMLLAWLFLCSAQTRGAPGPCFCRGCIAAKKREARARADRLFEKLAQILHC